MLSFVYKYSNRVAESLCNGIEENYVRSRLGRFHAAIDRLFSPSSYLRNKKGRNREDYANEMNEDHNVRSHQATNYSFRGRWNQVNRDISFVLRDTKPGYREVVRFKRYRRLIKAELKATFKFRRRGTVELPGKRRGAKSSILSIRKQTLRRVAWNNEYSLKFVSARRQIAFEGRAIRPAIKSIK